MHVDPGPVNPASVMESDNVSYVLFDDMLVSSNAQCCTPALLQPMNAHPPELLVALVQQLRRLLGAQVRGGDASR